jgi:phosphatidylcholine synthase
VAAAWLVHLFTASGALLAYLALRDVAAGDLRRAFVWLFIATLVDAADGALARLARVSERTPTFNGARLDDIVDYLTFVFVPVFLLDHGGFLPPGLAGTLVAAAVLVSSAFGFSQAHAKTSDHFFTGFPSYWNIVAVYLVALRLSPWASAAWLVSLAVLVFVPIGYVYPSRTPTLRGLTVTLGVVWGVAFAAVIWTIDAPPRWLVLGSFAYPIYYAVLSLYLHTRRADR